MFTIIPITTVFIGLNGIIGFVLSWVVAMERSKIRVWHGESKISSQLQPDYLKDPNIWASIYEKLTRKFLDTKLLDDGVLQRKVRSHENFTEYVPLGLLFLLSLEMIEAPSGLIWMLGVLLTASRLPHYWSLINIYGPSPGRVFGYVSLCLVYILGSLSCLYYGFLQL